MKKLYVVLGATLFFSSLSHADDQAWRGIPKSLREREIYCSDPSMKKMFALIHSKKASYDKTAEKVQMELSDRTSAADMAEIRSIAETYLSVDGAIFGAAFKSGMSDLVSRGSNLSYRLSSAASYAAVVSAMPIAFVDLLVGFGKDIHYGNTQSPLIQHERDFCTKLGLKCYDAYGSPTFGRLPVDDAKRIASNSPEDAYAYAQLTFQNLDEVTNQYKEMTAKDEANLKKPAAWYKFGWDDAARKRALEHQSASRLAIALDHKAIADDLADEVNFMCGDVSQENIGDRQSKINGHVFTHIGTPPNTSSQPSTATHGSGGPAGP